MSVELPDPKDWGLSAYASAYGEACWNAALAASPPQEAQPVPKLELGDRFMEILRAIHGDMPDAFADSARLAFVHALKEAQPVPGPLTESQIRDIARDADLDWKRGYTLDGLNRHLVFARAIERIVVARMGERK